MVRKVMAAILRRIGICLLAVVSYVKTAAACSGEVNQNPSAHGDILVHPRAPFEAEVYRAIYSAGWSVAPGPDAIIAIATSPSAGYPSYEAGWCSGGPGTLCSCGDHESVHVSGYANNIPYVLQPYQSGNQCDKTPSGASITDAQAVSSVAFHEIAETITRALTSSLIDPRCPTSRTRCRTSAHWAASRT